MREKTKATLYVAPAKGAILVKAGETNPAFSLHRCNGHTLRGPGANALWFSADHETDTTKADLLLVKTPGGPNNWPTINDRTSWPGNVYLRLPTELAKDDLAKLGDYFPSHAEDKWLEYFITVFPVDHLFVNLIGP